MVGGLWCLHGFLGQGSDWDSLAQQLASFYPGPVHRPSLFAPGGRVPPLAEWVEEFGARVAQVGQPSLLLGYSLGARLALHLLLDRPGLWRGAVLVAPALGYANPAARRERQARDGEWAERFRGEGWDQLLSAWDEQPVFQGRPGPDRRECRFDRSLLALALERWSTGVQEDLHPRLGELDLPLLWVVGAEDIGYVQQARGLLTALPQGELWLAPGAAHRVPWEAQSEFNCRVEEFLRPLLQGDRDDQ